MNKEEIYNLLRRKNIWYEITEHQAVFNMKELENIDSKVMSHMIESIILNIDENYQVTSITPLIINGL